ncbi:hypothetical protein OAO99_01120 [Candidatus Pelagibacter sp.]|nr:hypothetical protein [Candidatus Pelagibacter sp.]
MFKRLILLTFSLIVLNFYSSNSIANECDGSPWNKTILDNKDKHYEFSFLEERNDSGIFFDFKWDKDLKKIIVRRDKDKYPIVRFSLFNKLDIKQGSVIKSVEGNDLSTLSDDKLNAIFLQNLNFGTLKLELKNGNKITVEAKPYKLNDFKLVNFQLNSIQNIDSKKGIIEISFDSFFENNRPDLLNTLIKNNFDYDENNKEALCEAVSEWIALPIKAIEYNEFKYDEDVRKGLKNKTKLKDSVIDFSFNEGKFRVVRSESGVGFFRQEFDFKKFPFDKQKLIINITSGIRSTSDTSLNKTAKDTMAVTFITPENGAFLGLDNFKEKNYLKEWKVLSVDIKSKEIINENYYDKDLKKNITHNENTINLEINIEREYKHYIYKIIIPVFLILCVAWFVLWIPTKHFETRLTTSMVALLSLIAYNFVFADDIPKLQYLTSLDKYILLSYVFCCIPTFMSIWCSRFIKISQAKVTRVNRKIRTFGGLIYLVLSMQIFYS